VPGAQLKGCNITQVTESNIPPNPLSVQTNMGANVFTVTFNNLTQVIAQCVLDIIKAENQQWNDDIAFQRAFFMNSAKIIGAIGVACLGVGIFASIVFQCLDKKRGPEAERQLLLPRHHPGVAQAFGYEQIGAGVAGGAGAQTGAGASGIDARV
jgi:hypothetical protein